MSNRRVGGGGQLESFFLSTCSLSQLVRQSKEQLLRHCQFIIRKQRSVQPNQDYSWCVCSVCVCSQSAYVHSLRVFAVCVCSQSACVHSLRVFTVCVCSQSVCVHSLRMFTVCVCSQSACVHSLRVFTVCVCSHRFDELAVQDPVVALSYLQVCPTVVAPKE